MSASLSKKAIRPSGMLTVPWMRFRSSLWLAEPTMKMNGLKVLSITLVFQFPPSRCVRRHDEDRHHRTEPKSWSMNAAFEKQVRTLSQGMGIVVADVVGGPMA